LRGRKRKIRTRGVLKKVLKNHLTLTSQPVWGESSEEKKSGHITKNWWNTFRSRKRDRPHWAGEPQGKRQRLIRGDKETFEKKSLQGGKDLPQPGKAQRWISAIALSQKGEDSEDSTLRTEDLSAKKTEGDSGP